MSANIYDDMFRPEPPPPPLPVWLRAAAWLIILLMAGVGLLVWKLWPVPAPLHDVAAQPRPIEPAGDKLPEEQANIRVYQQAWKSVVSITTLGFRRNLFYDLEEVQQGAGSGFIWDERGYVVTNFHVIQDAQAAEVALWDSTTYKARAVGVAPDHDLAVLKIDAPADKLMPITVGTSHDIVVGQHAYAIGNPFGLGHTFTSGVISALDRRIKSVTGRPIDGVLQTSAAINPGNSGGPLLDSSARLIGVNTAIYSPSGASAGIGFAIPVDTVNRIVPELIRRGKVDRPGLGVQIAPASLARRLGIKSGVLVREVIPGGAAASAGIRGCRIDEFGRLLQLGDVIVAVDDQPVGTSDDLLEQLGRRKIGDAVRISVLRDGNRLEIRVNLQPI